VASRMSRLGSSPLARGLLSQIGERASTHGIIPARAGFTPHPQLRAGARRDHPRSRGVYRFDSSPGRDDKGSSPLARGLLVISVTAIAESRIIPARAGFTADEAAAGPRVLGHPRSRGVYQTPENPRPNPPGSSPLARGLRRGWE